MLLTTLVDLSRWQFALTAMYHWLFVPLTLGLGFLIAFMETRYVMTGDEFWKRTTKFWMKLFAVNFAMGVATGIILEFEFGDRYHPRVRVRNQLEQLLMVRGRHLRRSAGH